MQVGQSSPWGKIDYIRVIAAGVEVVGTPGHGGIKLSRENNALVHKAWRSAGGWYEEDEAVAVVMVTFPSLFDAERVKGAIASCKSYRPDEYSIVFGIDVDPSVSHVLRKRAFDIRHHHEYVVTSASGDWHEQVPKGFVGVLAVRQMDGDRRRFLIPSAEYDAKREFGFVVDLSQHQAWVLNG